MGKPKKSQKSVVSPDAGTVRASISFPTELYKALEEKARQKKVSLAWIVRDAAEKYVEEKTEAEGAGAQR